MNDTTLHKGKWENGKNGGGEVPKGKLILIGGKEDKGTDSEGKFPSLDKLSFFKPEILNRFIEEIREVRSHIIVVTTASSIPNEVGKMYLEAFHRLGVRKVEIMHIHTREEANSPAF